MKKKIYPTLRLILGISLIIFGIAGMILPILPGWWVALLGLQILGIRLVINNHKPWRQIISFRRRRVPKNKFM
ncbi:MAG: hypothetical protein ABII80_02670 [bacterium]